MARHKRVGLGVVVSSSVLVVSPSVVIVSATCSVVVVPAAAASLDGLVEASLAAAVPPDVLGDASVSV